MKGQEESAYAFFFYFLSKNWTDFSFISFPFKLSVQL